MWKVCPSLSISFEKCMRFFYLNLLLLNLILLIVSLLTKKHQGNMFY